MVGAGGGGGGVRAAGAREIGDECVAVIAEIDSRLHALRLADRSRILALQGRLAEAENTLKERSLLTLIRSLLTLIRSLLTLINITGALRRRP